MDLSIQKKIILSKYEELSKKYEPEFNLFIDKKEYNKDILYEGIREYKAYIINYFRLLFIGGIISNSKLEKINQAIAYRYIMYLGSKEAFFDNFKETIEIVVENSIYYALGIETYKKRNFIFDRSSSFINHVKYNIAGVLINNELRKIEFNLDGKYEKEDTIKQEIIFKELENFKIPQSVKSKLYNYLNGDVDFSKLDSIDILVLRKIWEMST